MSVFKSLQIKKNLFLNKVSFDLKTVVEKVQLPKNFIFICDVSGSMYDSLPRIRTQLKNRISSLLNDNDTISIIWFSGLGQSGILKEGVQVNNLTQLQDLHKAIDKFLVPQGLTCFSTPIELCTELITRLEKSNSDALNSMCFLSDGYHNSGSWESVISNLEKLSEKISSSTFIEYGYYADSKRLEEMAELVGGSKVFAENFDDYEPKFENIVKQENLSKKIEFSIDSFKSEMELPFLFSFDVNGINVFNTQRKKSVFVPENTENIYFLSKKELFESTGINDTELYASIFVLAEKMKYNYVDQLFEKLGDIKLYDEYVNSYGKQKLNSFKDSIRNCIFDAQLRFLNGKKENFTPNKNAYCVMNLINDLMSEDNLFYTNHEDFSYNRIGAKRVQKSELSDSDREKIIKAKSVKDVQKIVSEITIPVFEQSDELVGFSFENLVWNEKRANLSVRTMYTGVVKLPKNKWNLIEVPSYIYRNYTIIKDGILNVTKLPVKLTKNTYDKLSKKMSLPQYVEDGIITIDFSQLPIINRGMTMKISAKELAEMEYDLIILQGHKKYFDYFDKKFSPKSNVEMAKQHDKECSDWLQSIGITEWNGFNPKTEAEKSGDVYMALVLDTKIEKLSSLPKVEDVLKKIESGKSLTISEGMIKNAYDLHNQAKVSKLYETLSDKLKKDVDSEFITKLKKESVERKRELQQSIAETKFSLILSKGWFKEFSSFDENEILLSTPDNGQLKVKFDYKEVEEAL